MPYQRPAMQRFGPFRELTRVGCVGGSDGAFFNGATSSVGVGSRPSYSGSSPVTADLCFVPFGSR
jgi:hypothetical protein